MLSLDPNVLMTENADGAVLLDQRAGRYWVINDTGAVVLRRLLDGGTIEEAVEDLCASYASVERARADREARALAGQLRTSGLVTT